MSCNTLDDALALHQQRSGEIFIMSSMLVYDQIWCFGLTASLVPQSEYQQGVGFWQYGNETQQSTAFLRSGLFCIQRSDGKLLAVHRLDAHLVIPDASNNFH